MEYTWQFRKLKAVATQGALSDVVVSVDYRIGYGCVQCMAYHYGTITFAAADPENFTEFSEITESQMRTWVENTLGDELTAIQSALEAEVANPVTERDLPWLQQE